MKVTVTGGGGFLGARLADYLLENECPLRVSALLLTDVHQPTLSPKRHADSRVSTLAADVTAPGVAEQLVAGADVLFHLAAVVSGHAEIDFDLGLRVNFDATRALLEAARRKAPNLRFVFASTVGVFGGEPPPAVGELTVTAPHSSYGAAKAMSELLVNDYARRGWADARAVRLPTVSVRGGAPNLAVTSFASGIVREPLNGEVAVCPVGPEVSLWVSSPGAVVRNLVHAARVPPEALGAWRVVNLPGIRVRVRDMVAALRAAAGNEVAALVRFERVEELCRLVQSFPSEFDVSRALKLGFIGDTSFVDVVQEYMREIGKQSRLDLFS